MSYLIFQGKIWSKAKAEQGNRKYTGANAHNKHLHISIVGLHSNDVSPWFPWLGKETALGKVVSKVNPLPKKKVTK